MNSSRSAAMTLREYSSRFKEPLIKSMTGTQKPKITNCCVAYMDVGEVRKQDAASFATLENIADIPCVLRPPWMAGVPKIEWNNLGRLAFGDLRLLIARPGLNQRFLTRLKIQIGGT